MTDDLRKLANAATPGPWELYDISERNTKNRLRFGVKGPSEIVHNGDGIVVPDQLNDRTFDEDNANAAYIVAACNALPALLDRIETLEKALMEIARPTRDNGVGYARQIARAALQGGE